MVLVEVYQLIRKIRSFGAINSPMTDLFLTGGFEPGGGRRSFTVGTLWEDFSWSDMLSNCRALSWETK
jgi:hypothetical protein